MGDFSNRTRKKRKGNAYKRTYKWLEKFHLLALESTDDLIPNHDIGIIPINTLLEKPISPLIDRLARISFLRQMNHPYLSRRYVRRRMLKHFGERYQTKSATWILPELFESDIVHLLPLDNDPNPYRLLASRSIFTLCPAGYGSWTYRFFNAIQWGSVSILLSDQCRLPFNDEIPYENFMLSTKDRDVALCGDIVSTYSEKQILDMQIQLAENQWRFKTEYIDNPVIKNMQRIAYDQ